MTQATKLSPEEQATQNLLVREEMFREICDIFKENIGKSVWSCAEDGWKVPEGEIIHAKFVKTKYKDGKEKKGAIYVQTNARGNSYLLVRTLDSILDYQEIEEENALKIMFGDGKFVKYYFFSDDSSITSK